MKLLTLALLLIGFCHFYIYIHASTQSSQVNVASMIQQLGQSNDEHSLSKFATLLRQSGLTDSLSKANNVTVFVPNNRAINNRGGVNVNVVDLIHYHILPDTLITNQTIAGGGFGIMDTELIGGQDGETSCNLPDGVAQKLILFYSGNDTKAPAIKVYYGTPNPASTVNDGIVCSNGIIYIVDTLILFPTPFPQTLTAFGLDPFREALANNSLTYNLTQQQGLTLFAPNVSDFDYLSKLSPEARKEVLLYHAVNDVAYTNDFNSSDVLVSEQGKNLNITLVNGVYYVNDARIVYPNIPTFNGVIHVIEKPLDPNATWSLHNITKPNNTSNNTRSGNGTGSGLNNGNSGNEQSDASSLFISNTLSLFLFGSALALALLTGW